MIKLQVEPYCQDCPYFKPDYEDVDAYSSFLECEVDHIIRCKHGFRCEVAAKWTREHFKENKGGDHE